MLRDKCQDIGEVKFAEMRGNDVGMVRFASECDAERAVCILLQFNFIPIILLISIKKYSILYKYPKKALQYPKNHRSMNEWF